MTLLDDTCDMTLWDAIQSGNVRAVANHLHPRDQRDPRAAVTGPECNRAAPGGSSPTDDAGTAGVVSLRECYAFERFVGELIDLLDDDQIDKARDVLRSEWRAIHGVG